MPWEMCHEIKRLKIPILDCIWIGRETESINIFHKHCNSPELEVVLLALKLGWLGLSKDFVKSRSCIIKRYPEEVEINIFEQSGVNLMRIRKRVWKNFLWGQPSSVHLGKENYQNLTPVIFLKLQFSDLYLRCHASNISYHFPFLFLQC